MVQASDSDASWTPPCGGVPGPSNWEVATGQSENILEGYMSKAQVPPEIAVVHSLGERVGYLAYLAATST